MTVSIDRLKASDGTGESPRATVTNSRSISGTTITVDTISNWPSTFVATTGTLLTNGTLDPATVQVFDGHVSGSDIVIDTFAPGYSDLGNSVGDIVVLKPTTSGQDQLVAALRVSHDDTGLINVTSSTFDTINPKTAAGVVVNGLKIDSEYKNGWITDTLPAVSSVTANGNHSYNIVFNSTVASILTPGMRGRTTRTVAAPTQATSLNGTTQYWSKTSPNKLTFTDDFVVSAWVKLSSYPGTAGAIASRYNGTSGWQMTVESTGQVQLLGFNAGAGNYSYVRSYQSVPLNKWVHVTAQLDMSTFTATTTTSYVMLDGVDVPATVARAGTNPTALVQAGDLQIGATNTASFFPGKIAQVAIYSAKVTQATILASINRGLSGSETSLASAYSFNGVATDLNTTTPNDLSANGSATATNADSPFGGQADGTISSTLDYFIVQSVSTTTAVVQVPEGCTIPTTGGVSAVAYSERKSPYNMPVARGKWTIQSQHRAQTSQVGAAVATWYNLGAQQLKLPIGSWVLGYETSPIMTASSVSIQFQTLSTANNTSGDTEFVTLSYAAAGSYGMPRSRKRSITTSGATIYYLNTSQAGGTSVTHFNLDSSTFVAPSIVEAENSLL